MALVIKHVADLMGEKQAKKIFRIPSYQRGYRWERKQVEQLLDDLLEFQESRLSAKQKDIKHRKWNKEHPDERAKSIDNEDNIGFYCMQPLAVSRTGDDRYDVIDGQQRLTTIYLILSYISSLGNLTCPYDYGLIIEDALYELSYQTREDTFFQKKEFKSTENAVSNIDFYFMSKAYQTISEWFGNHRNAANTILDLLLPREYSTTDDDLNSCLHDVRFIWYDTPKASSISTFNNLNYGKIGLTAAELIKALLFQCDVYDVEKRDLAKKDAFSRSTKWSIIEEDLRNEFFWGMLTSSGHDKDLHIELILEFVASDIDNIHKYSEQEGWDRKDSDWVFNVFSKAIYDKNFTPTQDGQPLKNIIDRIEYIWEEIQKVYSVYRNWYRNRDIYHRIGLLILLKNDYEQVSREEVIRSLYEAYRKGTKPAFEDYLRKEIGDCVRIKKRIELPIELQQKIGKKERLKSLEEIKYDEDSDEIRKVLLLFNVQKTIEKGKEEMLFPFHLAHQLISLEHIHPQHLDESDIKYPVLRDWVETRSRILAAKGALKKDVKLTEAIKRLKGFLTSEDCYNNLNQDQEQQLHSDLSHMDNGFDELAGMKPEFMHTLYNMALVDEKTNSSLQNKLIDQKKSILNKIQEDPKNDSYIPIGTWYAFNKYFSDEITDMKFWRKQDREAYFTAIKDVYESYVK